MAQTEKASRPKKTAAEKAADALGVEQRRVDKLEAKHKELMDEAAALEPQIAAAKKQRDYLAQNPALPKSDPAETEDERQAANGNGPDVDAP